MEELIISMALALIKTFVKNPASAAKYKADLQEVAAAIDALYPPGT
jgi:hypothetical protein